MFDHCRNVRLEDTGNPDGKVYVWKGFPGPCPAPSQSLVLLEKETRAEVVVGEPYEIDITVSNRTTFLLKKVVVTDKIPKDFKFEGAEPQAQPDAAGFLTWNLGELGGKQKKTIKIRGSATAVGTLIHAGLAEVTFELPLAIPVRVVEPRLELVKIMPEEAVVGESIPLRLLLSNPGSALVTGALLIDQLPEGMTTGDGKVAFEVKVDKLRPGESREFTGTIIASKAGVYTNVANATADRGLKATATAKTVVRQPMLAVVKSGPKQSYIGQPIPYEIKVTNIGDAPTKEVAITDDSIPEFIRIVEAGEQGVVKGNQNRVIWTIGVLAPNESRLVHLVLQSDRICTITNTATVTGKNCTPKSATVNTEVLGIPGVLTEVRDQFDPVAVNGVATYTVRIINQGSKTATNLKMVCELEAAQTFMSGEGVTPMTAEGNKVVMGIVPELDAGKEVVWTVRVKAVKAGDIRFKTSLTSDQLTRPVDKFEATNQYVPEMVVGSSEDKK